MSPELVKKPVTANLRRVPRLEFAELSRKGKCSTLTHSNGHYGVM